jgi:hypothetical protein
MYPVETRKTKPTMTVMKTAEDSTNQTVCNCKRLITSTIAEPIAPSMMSCSPSWSGFWTRQRRRRQWQVTEVGLGRWRTIRDTSVDDTSGSSGSRCPFLHSNSSFMSDPDEANDAEQYEDIFSPVKQRCTRRAAFSLTSSASRIAIFVAVAALFFLFFACCLLDLRPMLLKWWDEEYYHIRHPLYFLRRPQSDKDIRYLTIGSYTTWGYGLEEYDAMVVKEDPSEGIDEPYDTSSLRPHSSSSRTTKNAHGYRQGYPYLLSPLVHNAASRVGGSEFAALCTQSIVGDKYIYDVIVLEFSFSSNNYNGLALLAERIRQRFPSATIILVQLWSPSQFVTTAAPVKDNDNDTSSSLISWNSWRSTHDNIALDSSSLESALQDYQWQFQDDARQDSLLQTVAESVHGFIVRLPRNDNAQLALAAANNWFFEIRQDEQNSDNQKSSGEMRERIPTDYEYALSPRGHEVLAEEIRQVVDGQDILRVDSLQQQQRNIVGTWGSGDQCQLWYETGNGTPNGYSKLLLRKFSTSRNDKYALEVPTTGIGGSLTISNPFDDERTVYLTYMTTSWAVSNDPSNKTNNDKAYYPRTQVLLNGKPSVVLDPKHDHGRDHPNDHHVTRTTAIGFVPAHSNDNIIALTSFVPEKALASFRIVGVSLFPTEEKRRHKIATEYALSPATAKVGRLNRRYFWQK